MLRLVPRITDEAPEALLGAGIPEQLARVLHARQVSTPEEARDFLSPSWSKLHDPFALRSMDVAVARVRRAIADGERICVFGDYDVDGVCAVAILVEALRAHGADVQWYIPSRHQEGYGLNAQAVRRIAAEARLLITVDCGITSQEEARIAQDLSLDLIITDHHEPPETLPSALAVLNPLLGAYPFRRLCGAGVAFKLRQALFGEKSAKEALDLVALATVADLVPLLGENRVLVFEGLKMLQQPRRVGLRALLEIAGLSGRAITAGHLGFQIGPRINAGGRIRDAARSATLLLTDDAACAEAIARELDEANQQRQRMEAEILQKANEQVQSIDFLRAKAIVVVGEGWNTGVIGLVASKLTDQYAWPAVVLSETDGILTGSARSIQGVNLYQALCRCEDLFLRFGGHAQAAGMTLEKRNLADFTARLNEAIAALAEPDAYVPTAIYDLEMDLSLMTISLIEQLERLAPTGFGNPAPIFRLTGAEILEARSVGVGGKHLKLRLRQGEASAPAIAFSQGALVGTLPDIVDALYSPTINEFLGKRSAQCEISKIVPHAPLESFRASCLARTDAFECALLETDWEPAEPFGAQIKQALVKEALTLSRQGTLLTVRTIAGLLRWLEWLSAAGLSEGLSYCVGAPADARRFNALCAMPERGAADGYARSFALDDALVPEAIAALLPTDDGLRDLYRLLRDARGRFLSEAALASEAGMRLATVRLGLRAFDELALIRYQPVPFRASLLPMVRCSLEESASLRRARRMLAMREAEA